MVHEYNRFLLELSSRSIKPFLILSKFIKLVNLQRKMEVRSTWWTFRKKPLTRLWMTGTEGGRKRKKRGSDKRRNF